MKQYFLSPLCSAFVVPGMGQVLNRHVKKGLVLMGLVFLLLAAATCEFIKLVRPALDPLTLQESGFAGILHQINHWHSSNLGLIAILSGMVWLYSVLDAFLYGIKFERLKKN
jgi:hypothetical protein